ncbi:P-loop containing nucleoside triphosphate hydrolase protein [Mycena metata]|uniref:P-loop containing nucleoside triphosphate hydrolase protein n=1 Tax=Mycena metata TaxID=1033252 RepID=A0AAD7N5Q8_9AGAR|nr:P-loop containing nucleoside triphosphate hydrolase protein [Mycena metata]
MGLSLWQASSVLLLMLTAGRIVHAGGALLMGMSGPRMVSKLRERLYAASLKQEVEKGEGGDVLGRPSVDTTTVGERVSVKPCSRSLNISNGLSAILLSSVGLGFMWYISPNLTMLMMLVVVPPISLSAVIWGRYVKELFNKTQEADIPSGPISTLRTAQAYNAHDQELDEFHGRIDRTLALARKELTASAAFFSGTGFLCLLGYGGSMVSQGQISIGDLTSLLLYTAYVGYGTQFLAGVLHHILSSTPPAQQFQQSEVMRAISADSRTFELLDRPDVPPHTGGTAVSRQRRGVLKFENVKFEHPTRKGVDILRDNHKFNLQIGVGESVAIIGGQSDGGVSSMRALLLRYYDPVEGKITFDGQDIREFSVDSWRRAIAVVPQDPALFTGTIAFNIACGNEDFKATREQIEQAAWEANCDFLGRLSLSGGQRQRLAIARALLKKPVLLVLDEVTSSRDATSQNRVNDAIDKILRNPDTSFLVFAAHRLSTIAGAQRIVVLEDGRVVESGTYRELISRKDSSFRTRMAVQLDAAAGEKTTPVNFEAGEVSL